MTENATTLSPSLVLSIGRLASRTAADVQALFLRSDPWRSRAVKFLTLTPSPKGGFSWLPLRSGHKSGIVGKTRAKICFDMIKSAASWQMELENALHDLRSHERVLRAGLEEKTVYPLNVVVMANLTEPFAAALFPLMVGLGNLLLHEPCSQVSLLLGVAEFSPSKLQAEAPVCLAANLDDLQALFAQPSLLWERLASNFVLKEPSFPNAQVFLFDRFKEGMWEVLDEKELSVLIGNSTLALLIGEGGTFAPAHTQSNSLLYNGMGAAMLFYDPAELMESCAARLGAEIIRSEFVGEALPELQAIDETVGEIASLVGDSRNWLESLLAETPFALHAGNISGVQLHFADLSFDGLPMEEWAYAIGGYDKYFGEKRYPEVVERLHSNAQKLTMQLAGALADALDGLPQQAKLYPGGLDAARKVIELLTVQLQAEINTYSPWDEADKSEQSLEQGVEDTLKLLDDAVDKLPKAPAWLRLVPSPAEGLVRLIFAMLYQRSDLARLMILRQMAIQTVEKKYATLLEKEARQEIHNLCKQFLEAYKRASDDVQILQATIYSACLRLEKRAALPGQIETLFRQPAVDPAVYEWAFSQGYKPAEELRLLLIEREGLLDNWKILDAKKIEAALMSFGRGLYQFTWHLTLDEVLAHRGEADLQTLWASLSQGAVPLLRPDFDGTGAGGRAIQSQIFLCQSAKGTPFTTLLRSPLSRWQVFSTGDPYLAFCLRLRQGIPLAALGDLYQRTQATFEKLEPNAMESLSLFGGKAEAAQ